MHKGGLIMATSEEEILKKLLANYENAILLIPENLRKEFRNKIIRPEKLKAYAPYISKIIEFQLESEEKSSIENQIAAQLGIKDFGRRLMLSGIRPEQVHAELMRGIFD